MVSDRHLLTFGPNGSGKSRRLLLPNLINLVDWSMLVIDIKGELAAWSAEHRRKAGNEVVFLNPFGAGGLPSTGFNPVAALDPTEDDFVDDALGLAEAIVREEGREPHWSASAQDLISALIMYSRLTGKNDGSLGHVRELLGQTPRFAPPVQRASIFRVWPCGFRHGDWSRTTRRYCALASVEHKTFEVKLGHALGAGNGCLVLLLPWPGDGQFEYLCDQQRNEDDNSSSGQTCFRRAVALTAQSFDFAPWQATPPVGPSAFGMAALR